MELVDFAVDIDVSASISPWVRPSLGDWLNNKKDQSDHIIILKIDRIARSVRHLSDIISLVLPLRSPRGTQNPRSASGRSGAASRKGQTPSACFTWARLGFVITTSVPPLEGTT